MKILVCGDIHGTWGPLNVLINQKQPNIILQVGDFGWWPHYHNKKGFNGPKRWNQYGLKNKDTKVYWCPGNHENWDELDKMGYGIHEVMDNVFYCSFGSTITLPDGRVVLFAGGADSIDKKSRVLGNSWWHQEIINYADMAQLPIDKKVDIIISHTLPFNMAVNSKSYEYYRWKMDDPSMKALDQVFKMYRPSLWYGGHFHTYEKIIYKDCEFTILSMPKDVWQWWTELKGDW